MRTIANKTYKITLEEFARKLGIKEKISHVSYYGPSCDSGKNVDEKTEEVDIEVELDV